MCCWLPPAILAIKRKRPDMSIDLLCGPCQPMYWSPIRRLTTCGPCPFPASSAPARGSQRLEIAADIGALAAPNRLPPRPYYASRSLVGRPARLSGGIPHRHGYATRGVAPFLTAPCQFQHQHALEQNLRLAETWVGAIARDHSPARIPACRRRSASHRAAFAEVGHFLQEGRMSVCIRVPAAPANCGRKKLGASRRCPGGRL